MLSTDTDILAAAESWRHDGRAVALATVIETWGSAPRPVGSHLVVDAEGNFLGSVSGGCVEGAVITEAIDGDRGRRAARPRIRRRGRDRVAGRTVLRGPHPGLRRAGRLMRADLLAGAQRRAGGAPGRDPGHRHRRRRPAPRARGGDRRRPARRGAGPAPRRGQERPRRGRRADAVPDRAGAAGAARGRRSGAYLAGAGADGCGARPGVDGDRPAHRLRDARALPGGRARRRVARRGPGAAACRPWTATAHSPP